MSNAVPSSQSALAGAPTAPYTVLARKYRPQTFEDLIGQEVMVRTLRNAFAMDRIAQAYMLTGVRGVGKTTTARILARALNYEGDEASGIAERPTLAMPKLGIHCRAIMESRHVDVLEMDAASHTGIDDIREIIEAVRYKPASARNRVFIIDEVHMLSKSAFNGLLKTLEEPPPHVKFIFATTEIRKVPVTILSRCQRFDLRRIELEQLMAHFADILAKEGYAAEDTALALIARAAEGSVRDGLSLLDQALALAGGHITADAVRAMIGLSSRAAILDLLAHIFTGDAKAALAALGALHDGGSDPLMILNDAADATHVLTRLKTVPESFPPDFSKVDQEQAAHLAAALPVPKLALAWQMLLKGLEEVAKAPNPFAAAEMLLIRMCYTANLPTPADIMGELRGPAGSPPPPKAMLNRSVERPKGVEKSLIPVPQSSGVDVEASTSAVPSETGKTPASRKLNSFEDIVACAEAMRDIKLKVALEEKAELVKIGPGFLELHILEGAPQGLAPELSRKLQAWTGERWVVSISEERGLAPLGARLRDDEARAIDRVRKHPLVINVLHHFPGAEIKRVRPVGDE